MLLRILPSGPKPEELPEPASAGARTLTRYCVQCHYLPSPYMHTPERWEVVVERMVRRMQGEGNLGVVLKERMEDVEAPSEAEVENRLAYLSEYGQKAIDPGRYPDLKTGGSGLRPAYNAMSFPILSAIPPRSGRRWWNGCRRTWRG